MTSLRYFLALSFLSATTWSCADDSMPELPPIPHHIATFGSWGNDPGEFEYPEGIALGPDSLLYITDSVNHRIQVITREGTFVRQWPVGGFGSTIRVAPDSSVWVAMDSRENPLHYTKEGKLIETQDHVNRVYGYELDSSGNLYVCGSRVHRPDPYHTFVEGPYFWKFNHELQLVKKWGYPGQSDTTGWLGGPMTWTLHGNLLMLGQIDSSTAVFEFTPDGTAVSSWKIPNVTLTSSDIACDRNGRILISSPYQGLVYVFGSRGRLLLSFNDVSSREEPLKMPTGITVDMSGFIYVVDFARFRIVKYEEAP